MRIVLIVLLSCGALLGFASGFHVVREHGLSVATCSRCAVAERQDEAVQRMAEACVAAAQKARN